jgi:periplasmic protein TonB
MKKFRLLIFATVALVHLVLIFCLSFPSAQKRIAPEDGARVMKLVDLRVRAEKPIEPKAPERKPEAAAQDAVAENLIKSDEKVSLASATVAETVDEYLPQSKVSQVAGVPVQAIQDRLVYPDMARKAGVEGLVYLELFVDATGAIRKIQILKETPPDFGFGAAAVKAFGGCVCAPAKANGVPVSMRLRYPIRFTLK